MFNKLVERKFDIDRFHTAFAFRYESDFVFRGERHDFWEVNLVTSGKITVTQDENVYTMGAGDILFHSPMVFHRLQSADGTKPTGYTFSFHVEGDIPEELSCAFFKLDQSELEELKSIMNIMIPFVNEEGSEAYTGQLAADMLSVFLMKLSLKISSPVSISSESAKEYRRIVRLMEKGITSNLTLEDFAKEESISLSYLKLLFNMYAGVTPKTYYDTLRAAEAVRLLKSGMTVNEVAEAMSFSSPNYFSVFFKRHFGLPPHKYITSKRSLYF